MAEKPDSHRTENRGIWNRIRWKDATVLTALDEQVKLPNENSSIGIIICKSKDKRM